MKFIPALFIILVLLFVALVSAGDSTTNCWREDVDPRPICSCDDLQNISADDDNLAADYEIQNDIDFALCGDYLVGSGFNPIGRASPHFSGSIDGQSHTISNLFINMSSSDYIGLIGRSYGGAVSNLGLVDVNITGENRIGGMLGQGSLYADNCYVTGLVNSTGSTGFAGGFIGWLSGGVLNTSYTNTTVYGTYGTGGFAGIDYGGRIDRCHSLGETHGGGRTGGFIGDIDPHSDPNNKITRCYSEGVVTGTYGAGGFGGSVYDTVTNCYSRATVTGTSSPGGFIGSRYGPITNCYSTGAVNMGGGFLGSDSSNYDYNCFWDTETSGRSTSPGDAVGKTTTQMKTISTFTSSSWDFSTVWFRNDSINDGYPYLLAAGETGLPIVEWNWAAANTSTTDDFVHGICITASATVNCTMDFNGTDVANATGGTDVCFYRNGLNSGNFSTINVRCDGGDENNVYTTDAWFNIDLTAPSLTWNSGVNTTTTVNTTTISLNATEAVNCTLIINGTHIVNTSSSRTISWNLTNYAVGNYSFYATCDDSVGNNAQTSTAWWNVDQTLVVDWNWADINSSISRDFAQQICVTTTVAANCTLNFNGTDVANSTSGTDVCFYRTGLSDGNYSTVNVSCEDAGGRKTNTTNAWLSVDTASPSVSWTDSWNLTSIVNSTSIGLTASEAVNCTLVINGTRIVNSTTATSISWNLTNYAEGNWSFYATCDDSVGNNANSSNAWWNVDLRPVVSWDWANVNSTIPDDAEKICVTVSKSVNCTLNFNGTSTANSTTGTNICFYKSGLSDGNYSTLNVSCEDSDRIKGNSTNAWLAVDTTGPSVIWSSRVNFASQINTTTVSINSNDTVNCTLTINSTRIVNSSSASSISWNLTNYAEGNWSFYATCEDSVGNKADSRTAWWMVDQTAPTLTWGWTVNTSSSSAPTPIISANEGLSACNLNISGTNYSMSQASYTSFSYSWSPAVGTYWLRGYCNDSANNSATTTLAWFEKTQASGGGSSCSKRWDCTDWSDCDGGEQTRTCKCDCLRDKDCYGSNDETRSCTVEEIEIIIEEEEPEEEEGVIIVEDEPEPEIIITLSGERTVESEIVIEIETEGGGQGTATVTSPQGESYNVQVVNGKARFEPHIAGVWEVSYTDENGNTVTQRVTVAAAAKAEESVQTELVISAIEETKGEEEDATEDLTLILIIVPVVLGLFIAIMVLKPGKPSLRK